MRKVTAMAVAAIAALVVAAVAYGAQVNTYTVTGKTSPTASGSKKKPVPISLDFDYTVGEQSGQRPSPVKRYTIGFYGVKSNGGLFPKCTAASINAAQSISGCPKGSIVGSGYIINAAGSTSDPADKSIECNLNLTIVNGGQGRAAIFLQGGPSIIVQGKPCVIGISQAIDARLRVVRRRWHGAAVRRARQPAASDRRPGQCRRQRAVDDQEADRPQGRQAARLLRVRGLQGQEAPDQRRLPLGGRAVGDAVVERRC